MYKGRSRWEEIIVPYTGNGLRPLKGTQDTVQVVAAGTRIHFPIEI